MTVIVSRNTVGTILLAQLLEEVQLLALLVCSLGYTIATGGWWKDGLVVEKPAQSVFVL